jgi:hypothetical protein
MNLNDIQEQYAAYEQANAEETRPDNKTVPVVEFKGTANIGNVSFIPLRIPTCGLPAVEKPKEIWDYTKMFKYTRIWVPFPLLILDEKTYALNGVLSAENIALIREVKEKLRTLGWYERHVYFTAYRGQEPKNPGKMSEAERHIISGLSLYFKTKKYEDVSSLDNVQKAVLGSLFVFKNGNIMTNYLSADEDTVMMYGYIIDATAKEFVPHKGKIVCILFKNTTDKEGNQVFWTSWMKALEKANKTKGQTNKDYIDDLLTDSVSGRKYYLDVDLNYSNNMPSYTVSVEDNVQSVVPDAALQAYNETNWVADITRRTNFFDQKAFEEALKRVNERLAYYEPNAASASQASPAAPDNNSGLPFDTKKVAGQTEIVTHNAQGGMTTTRISAPQQPASSPANDDLPF